MTTEAQTPATGENNQTPAAATAPEATLAAPATPATAAAPATADAPAAPATEPAVSTDKPADAPEGAPEAYADFALPEGLAFNTEVLDEFKTLAKERNLSQADAQKFTDLGAKLIQRSQEQTLAQLEATQNEWTESSRADKEFGGDKLDENLAIANKALATFGSPELTAMLKESKLSNHPEVIRAFYRVGKAIGEDKMVPGTTKPGQQTKEQRLFGNSNMNP